MIAGNETDTMRLPQQLALGFDQSSALRSSRPAATCPQSGRRESEHARLGFDDLETRGGHQLPKRQQTTLTLFHVNLVLHVLSRRVADVPLLLTKQVLNHPCTPIWTTYSNDACINSKLTLAYASYLHRAVTRQITWSLESCQL